MARQSSRLPFRYLEPACFAGLLDDPLLYLRIRPLRRALLFDCGQIAHLAKRVVKAIDTVFVSHAHMDHIMGLPTLVRHHHASPRPLDVYGPPGIAERVAHLLHGYDWNLCEPNWFTLRVHEVRPERIVHSSFPGPEGFPRRDDGEEERRDAVIWRCRYLDVAAQLCDHKLPVLAFRIDERPPFAVDPQRLQALGLTPGRWIDALKRRLWRGEAVAPGEALPPETDPEALYAALAPPRRGASIGYLTDVGWSAENLARLDPFLHGVTLLCAESAFLAADRAKARASFHLCSGDLDELVRRLTPRYLLPMHLSKSYLRRCDELYRELRPPPGTTVLPLPPHLVPPPLSAADVAGWLRPRPQFPGRPAGQTEPPQPKQGEGHDRFGI